MKIRTLDRAAMEAAELRQAQLTKPPGALGELERLAIRLAGMQGRVCPQVERVAITVFAADHGVTVEGVSAFPAEVTAQMVLNFLNGGAAISVLARHLRARLEVVDVGVAAELPARPGLVSAKVAPGTANLARAPAMTPEQLADALAVGRAAAERAVADGCELFIGGEMGIGNTTAATALICALTGGDPHALTGAGTGVDDATRARKAEVIARALALHGAALANPSEALRRVCGLEIAALTEAFLACGEAGVPVLVDGVIASAAALAACRMVPELSDWLLWGHRSQEPAQQAVFEALGARPLLDLDMRLGEGSGAAVAVPIVQAACRLHGEMATFAEAGVSDAH